MLIKQVACPSRKSPQLTPPRVRTLTGKEIELDIEPHYLVRLLPTVPIASR
jgi:hypothetical protein